MALLYLLHRHHIQTIVVHINYRLREEASDKDQSVVEEVSALWNLECVSIRLDPDESEGKNFQSWARDRRYQIFRDIKKEFNADYISTAHHEDDQLETILQKMMRGAGFSAWKGMDVLDGDLFRPLLDVPKSDILRFIQEFNIPYRMDRTNEESTYARNFIRNNWFPELNRLFPGWKINLLQIPDKAREFSLMADHIFRQIFRSQGMIDRRKFLDLPEDLHPVMVKKLAQESMIEITLSRGFLDSLRDIGELQTGKSLTLSDNAILFRDRDSFKLIKNSEVFSENINISKKEVIDGYETSALHLSLNKPPETFIDQSLHLDANTIEFPLTLRNWKDGDRFQPLGMGGSQLVSDHLTNRKIPSSLKKQAKVLESFDGIISAVIFPHHSGTEQLGTLSDRVRCTPETKQTLTIRKK